MRHAEFMQIPAADRLASVEAYRAKHPSKVPMVVSAADNAPPIAQAKFAMHEDSTMANLSMAIRRAVGEQIPASDALFLLVLLEDGSSVLVPGSETAAAVHRDYAHQDDGLVHVRYSLENTFGFLQ